MRGSCITAENRAVVRVANSDAQAKARIKELKRAARNDSMGGSLSEVEEMLSQIDLQSEDLNSP